MIVFAGVTIITLSCVLGLLLSEEAKEKSLNRPVALIPKNSFKDRRGDPRLSMAIEIPYSQISGKKKQQLICYTKDISPGGTCIKLSEKLAKGTHIKLFFPPETSAIIGITNPIGKVVWVKENNGIDENGKRLFDTGIQFLCYPSDINNPT